MCKLCRKSGIRYKLYREWKPWNLNIGLDGEEFRISLQTLIYQVNKYISISSYSVSPLAHLVFIRGMPMFNSVHGVKWLGSVTYVDSNQKGLFESMNSM